MGNHEEAITEYKRFIFFADSPDDVKLGMLRLSEAYRRTKRWDLAAETLHNAIPLMEDESEVAEARIKSALDMICAGEYSSAKLELIEVAEDDVNRSSRIRARFLLGVSEIYENRWENARKELIPSLREMGIDGRSVSKIDRLLAVPPPGRRSPKIASFLSVILPGSGQIYAGDWKSGINAFILNGLILLWAGSEIRSGDLSDGLMVLTLILPRYYLGNIRRSREIVESRNRRADLRKASFILQELNRLLRTRSTLRREYHHAGFYLSKDKAVRWDERNEG
jgi:hypothetical protein